ncbi:uncharacterized protein SCHCODRAFT_01314252 [Schizophyllum commune H4-8]|uniref:uncharacterized protein n=1 Tax=Schizophyllum commune (strain H4-8 / FGSC 9210) TaxID=578458 RepID=UPI00215EAE1C|nr:uncharacterized protein SCHCODRAFT_01314252 [Schizophyllum commune H4-8]KAI5889944.1 hypothetical protein SCHCODRAFT_01314252 [Schizophyllum commune H4-8]
MDFSPGAAPSPTSRPPSLRRSSGRVFVDRTPSTQLDGPVLPSNDASPGPSTSTANGISTSVVNCVPTSTEIHPDSTAVLSTSPPASRLSWQTTLEQPRIGSGISAPPEHLAARIQSIEADARFLHSEPAILHAARAILHRDGAALHGERATLHAAGETVVEVDEDILIDMSDVSTYTEGPELNVPYTDGEEQDDADDDTEDETFFDALEELASLADYPAFAESSSFSADSNTSPPRRPAERPSTIPSYLLHAMADPSATLLQESTSYPARASFSGLAASQAQSNASLPAGHAHAAHRPRKPRSGGGAASACAPTEEPSIRGSLPSPTCGGRPPPTRGSLPSSLRGQFPPPPPAPPPRKPRAPPDATQLDRAHARRRAARAGAAARGIRVPLEDRPRGDEAGAA